MFSYRVDKSQNLVLTTASGVLTNDELAEHIRTVIADPNIRPEARALIDFREVTSMQVTREGIGTAVELFRVRSPFAKTAFVATAPAVYGMGRMYELMRTVESEVQIRVFENIEEARLWLELDEPT